MIVNGRVSWFKLDKKFGFVEFDDGSGGAFLHITVLKSAGYVSVPAGTAMRVRVEQKQGRPRIVEVIDLDTTSAHARERPPIRRKHGGNESPFLS